MTSSQDLRHIPDRGRLNGFSNLWRKELMSWWGPRFWWLNLIRWTLLVNGLFAFIALVSGQELLEPGQTRQGIMITLFFGLLFGIAGIVVIIRSQGSIVGERQSGTAAWVLSKPVSRAAFILAKFAANAAGLGSFLLIEAVIGYWNVGYWAGGIPSPAGFVEACLLAILTMFFYLTLTLMLGTLFKGRGAVAGGALALLISGQNHGEFPALAHVGPFRLGIVAPMFALGQPVRPGIEILVATTVLEIVLMVSVAVTRFAGEDL